MTLPTNSISEISERAIPVNNNKHLVRFSNITTIMPKRTHDQVEMDESTQVPEQVVAPGAAEQGADEPLLKVPQVG